MKITLVYPQMWVRKDEFFGITQPLGLCYIASVLEKEHQVTIINAQEYSDPIEENGYKRIGLSTHKIVQKIIETKPDIVGISCPLSIMWNDVVGISRLLRQEYDCIQVIGGFQPSAFPEICLADSCADYVIAGEGEIAFQDIVDGKVKEKIVKRQLITDLDTIPFPARHLVNMEKYIEVSMAQGSQKRKRYTTVVTSRGCVNNCTFCSSKVVWSRKWRARSAENVVAEIEHLKEKYNINEIHFEDDNISLDKKRMNKICDLIIEKDLDISWTMPNGIASGTLDKDTILKMKKSGCYQLNFGIESGNNHILKNVIKKNMDLNHTKEVIQWTKDAGIFSHAFFILGFPGETKEMIYDSLAYAKESGLDSAFWNIATPYPATELYEMMNVNIDFKDFNKLRGCDNALGSDVLSADELKAIQKDINRQFFKYGIKKQMNPMNIISKIKNIDDLNYYMRKLKRVLKVW